LPAGTEWQLVKARDVDAVTHIEIVVPAVEAEIGRILRGVRLVRAAGIADAVAPGPLRSERQTGSEAAIERGLHGVIVVRATAGLEIHLSETIAELENGNGRAG